MVNFLGPTLSDTHDLLLKYRKFNFRMKNPVSGKVITAITKTISINKNKSIEIIKTQEHTEIIASLI
ncbi:hypothetical protein, partial [Citrobacter koseri]|uniref:hypothetical protein n=1 Tax=Citrobacter koseri TaxID=545 RepID=UPI001A91B9B9